MSETTVSTFTARQVGYWRRKAGRVARQAGDWPDGWSVSDVDIDRMVRAFPSLRLKSGWTLQAYLYRSGGNGNGFVYAIPDGTGLPEPDDCPRAQGTFLGEPIPPNAAEHGMDAIEGDGGPVSWLAASILSRELAEFGALWHGCDWCMCKVVDRPEGLEGPEDSWTWRVEPRPCLEPTVTVGPEEVKVCFCYTTEVGRRDLIHVTETYPRNSWRASGTRKAWLADGGGGIIF